VKRETAMKESTDYRRILGMISDEQVLTLEQAAIRIPSSSFEEQELADYLANYMSDMGLDVEMMEVQHPTQPEKKSRQPIGRLKGTDGRQTLMLNGHMDPGVEMGGWTVDPYGAKFEDGWIWGMGAHDDKGGVVAAICAVDAIKRSKTPLRDDILICPVVAHKYGGAGTRALIKKGVLADYCINMEHSANTIATVCVGIVRIRIKTKTPDLFFRYSAMAKAKYFNAIEQQCEIIRRIGTSLEPLPPGDWLRFTPHPELPGFPTLTLDTIHKEHYYYPSLTGMSSRECEMCFQIRTVPGQSLEGIRADVKGLLEEIKTDRPNLQYNLAIPAYGENDPWYMEPMEVPKDNPLVLALAEGQKVASDQDPTIGGALRIGNVGDGNLLAALEIPTVQYGPGDIRIYKEWPTPDERVRLDDLVIATRAIAYASCRMCG
jgi:acetylornithine deacetylase/succinyl-diaminopimelate desuccinylase-like protein